MGKRIFQAVYQEHTIAEMVEAEDGAVEEEAGNMIVWIRFRKDI